MPNIAIVGASGLVGASLIEQLNCSYIDANYYLFGNKSRGNKVIICNKTYIIQDIANIFGYKLDYALFMSDERVAQQYIGELADSGVVCIDNSKYYRMIDGIPLVIASVNGNQIDGSNIIANPNCTTIQLAIVLNALKKLGLVRVVCSTYQAVSGAGREGIADWSNKCQYGSLQCMPHPIVDNIIPHIDKFAEDGITLEEYKVINETRKILSLPSLPISCLAVRVPVSIGHGISANIELSSQYSIAYIKQLLSVSPNIIVRDDCDNNIYPMPLIARGTPYVYVGRITRDIGKANCINCFIVADNLIRGASYNALEILMHLLQIRR